MKKSGPALFTGPFFLPSGSIIRYPVNAVSAAKPRPSPFMGGRDARAFQFRRMGHAVPNGTPASP